MVVYSVIIVVIICLPIEYSVIVSLTGLPIGYSVIVALFVEIACPADTNILGKEDEKVAKYHALDRELCINYCQPVDIIPVVFGHSGLVSSHHVSHLRKLPSYSGRLFSQLQQAAILGTISILRLINLSYA